MVSLGHERKSVRHAEHMVLYIVDHRAFCFFLHECRNQVPHRFAQGPHILLKRRLQCAIKAPSTSTLALRRALYSSRLPIPPILCSTTRAQGSDPGGGKRGPLQEKKSSESVAQRAARARPTQWRLHFCTQSGNVITLCFGYYTSNSRPTEKHPFCHAGLSYCRCLPNSDRNSQLSSFLSPSFELASFPHLHPAIVFLSHPFLAS